ncbi:MAG TPA: insulinase family protein, partial [Bacteroidales bacterium]|nr:insulinase family protein [Bacteroidales bacterium]
NGLEMLYVQNTENATFNLIYYFDFGSDHDKMINLAAQYLQFLGTSRLSSEEISQEFFKLACTFSVTATRDQTSISLSGLSENQEKAVRLLEELLVDCQPNQKALDNLVATILKARADAKANQNANFQALVNYATFGPLSPTTNILSEAQLKALTPQDLISIIRNLNSYPHTVIYYGPLSLRDARRLVQREHKVPRRMLTAPEPILFEIQPTDDNRVFFAHYDANQAFLQTISRGVDYDMNLIPEASLYNAYFGGGMNAIVFQELRERRGLAYTARSRYATPARPNDPFMNTGFIATQNDKVIDAFDAFNELFDSMPLSEKAFQLAQESILSEIATNRITRMGIVWDYLSARRMNRNFDIRTKLWEQIPTMTLQDVEAFNHKFIRNRPKTYVILSNEAHMDFDKLQQRYGTLIRLTREDIFGY